MQADLPTRSFSQNFHCANASFKEIARLFAALACAHQERIEKLTALESLRLRREAKLTEKAYKIVAKNTGALASNRQIQNARRAIRAIFRYEIVSQSHVELLNAVEVISNRLIETGTRRVVLYADKGGGVTKVTALLPDATSTPQSPYEHNILFAWFGGDGYIELKKTVDMIEKIIQLDCELFVDGDLAFLAAIRAQQLVKLPLRHMQNKNRPHARREKSSVLWR